MKEETFDTVFDKYYRKMVFFCTKIVEDKDLAEDIVQEAFLNYWENREHISKDELALKTYLYKAIKNRALNVFRRGLVHQKFTDAQKKVEPSESTIVESIIHAELITEIGEAIESLPEKYRVISKMAYFEGKTTQEIADELGLSAHTVKKQRQRVLELLRLKISTDIFVLILAIMK